MATKTRNVSPTTVVFNPTSGKGYDLPLMYDNNIETKGYINASSVETHGGIFGGFDFSWLPDDATIKSISVGAYGFKGSSISSRYGTAALVKDATGNASATDLGDGNVTWINATTEKEYIVSFPNALSTCTPAFLKSGALQLRIRAINTNVYIYEMYVILEYEAPTSTITVNATEGGNATGGGEYENGTSVTLTATPNTGYKFKQWSDGNTSASRTVTVTANATYTAIFEKEVTSNVFAGTSRQTAFGGTMKQTVYKGTTKIS